MNLFASLPIVLSLLLAQSAPQPFRLSRIGVIMLGVKDMTKSVDFYHDRLGMAYSSKSEDFTFFEAGAVTLALNADLSRIGPASGSVEVVFQVEHVKAAFEALKQRGIAFEIDPRQVTGPNWAANFRDPDGHLLSIFGPE